MGRPDRPYGMDPTPLVRKPPKSRTLGQGGRTATLRPAVSPLWDEYYRQGPPATRSPGKSPPAVAYGVGGMWISVPRLFQEGAPSLGHGHGLPVLVCTLEVEEVFRMSGGRGPCQHGPRMGLEVVGPSPQPWETGCSLLHTSRSDPKDRSGCLGLGALCFRLSAAAP